MLKRLLTALSIVLLLTGFVAGCGGDDDDDDDATEETSADDSPSGDDDGGDAKAAFCADLNEAPSGGDTPVEQVQASADLAAAAAEEAPDEYVDALELLADFAQQAADGAEDGVVTQEATAELAASTDGMDEAFAAASEYCGA